MCPCCQDLVRLSDLRLKIPGSRKTWRDKFDLQERKVEQEELEFDDVEREMRVKAIERGRGKVPSIISTFFDQSFRKLKYDPYDIKALMHPVDFVVFDGLNKGNKINNVTFLARRSPNPYVNAIRKSLKDAVDNQAYDWEVARILEGGGIKFEIL